MTTRHRRPNSIDDWGEIRRRFGRGLPWLVGFGIASSLFFGYLLGVGEPDNRPFQTVFVSPSDHRGPPSRPVSGLGDRCPTEDSCKLDYRNGQWHVIPITP